jgi:hypothetical protein
MADAREFGTQELVSARYLANTEEGNEPYTEQLAPRVQAGHSGLEQTVRWLTPIVVIMLVTAGGGLYWQNRANIASTAGELKKRRCAVDLLLWASGSKQTFNGALSDSLKRAQRDSAYQFDQTKPAFKTQFDGVDFQDLSEAWNGKQYRGDR